MDKKMLRRECELLLWSMAVPKRLVYLLLSVGALVGSFFLHNQAEVFRTYYFLLINLALYLPVKRVLYYLPLDETGVFREIKIRLFLRFSIIMLFHVIISGVIIFVNGMDFGVYIFGVLYYELALAVFLVFNAAIPVFYLKSAKISNAKEIFMLFIIFMMIMIQYSICLIKVSKEGEGYEFFLSNPIFLLLTALMYALLVYSTANRLKRLRDLCRNYEDVEEKKRHFFWGET